MKKILSLLLVCVLCVSMFAGCNQKPSDPPVDPKPSESTSPTEKVEPTNPTETPDIEPTQPQETLAVGVGFNEFDTAWINYLNNSKSNENYMISPLSLKMAVALAAAGANTDTLDELLAAFDFENLDSYLNWGKNIVAHEKAIQEDIESRKNSPYMEDYDGAFDIANSVWHNSDAEGKFTDLYKQYMTELDALFMETPGAELKDEINNWVNEKTNGLIPELFADDLSAYTNILINTLYMKCAWLNTFSEHMTKEDDFTTINGDVVKKEMMNQEDDFLYYEDKDAQMIILPMENGINMAIVLGSNENILDKINNAKSQLVNVTMPKFEVETTIDNIIPFLQQQGVNLAFDSELADFSNMMDSGNYIDKIIQKTKIKLDENGVEAAAVTAIVMDATSAMPPEPVQPIFFIADEPFEYYIYTTVEGAATPELLFYGQYVK